MSIDTILNLFWKISYLHREFFLMCYDQPPGGEGGIFFIERWSDIFTPKFILAQPLRKKTIIFLKFLREKIVLKTYLSMRSMSVTETIPPSPQPSPIRAKFLRSSQPIAPDPTRKYFFRPSSAWNSDPNTAIWPSYLNNGTIKYKFQELL